MKKINIKEKLKSFWAKLPISNAKKQKIMAKLDEKMNYEPQIGIFGKTGVGKSSLCNALFGKKIASVSDVAACTRKEQNINLQIGISNGVRVVDVPGVGESLKRDEEYRELYIDLMPKLDAIFWLLKEMTGLFLLMKLFIKILLNL